MALPAAIQAIVTRFRGTNNNAYSAANNPLGMGQGGQRQNFPPRLKDMADALDFVAGQTDVSSANADATAADVLLTAEDAENTRLDRIATAENVIAAASEVVKAAAQAEALVGTSTSVNAPGLGNRVFQTQAGKQFRVGGYVMITNPNPLRWMFGRITSYNASSGSLAVDVESHSALTEAVQPWTIQVAGARGAQGIPGVPTLGYVTRATNIQIGKADTAKLFDLTGTFTQTFDTPANLGPDWYAWLDNSGTGTITLSGVSGLASVASGALVIVQCDGTTIRGFVANASGKGRAGGFAELDAEGKLPLAQSRSLGSDQSWQSVSRSLNVSYQNTTGRAIVVSFAVPNANPTRLLVSNNNSSFVTVTGSSSATIYAQAVIPSGVYYKFEGFAPNVMELR